MESEIKHMVAYGEESLSSITSKLKEFNITEASHINKHAIETGTYIKVPEPGGPWNTPAGVFEKAWIVYWNQGPDT